jgi:DUF4097 and DUF4098 domain-containing protein YvlB
MSYATLRANPAYLAAIPLAVTLLLTSCDPGSTVTNNFIAEEQFSITVDVVDQTKLSLEATNGTIRVTGVVDGTTVTVQGTKLVWGNTQADADAGLDFLDVVVDEGPDEFVVSTNQPTTGSRIYAVEYEIRLPDNLQVATVSGNGDIIVEFVRDNVNVAAVNANINLDQIEGGVGIELVNGNLDAKVTLPLNGTVDAIVGNGNITLEIPITTSAQVTFEIVCCSYAFDNIELEGLETSPPGVFPPTVTGTLGAGQGTISLGVGNGVITLVGIP